MYLSMYKIHMLEAIIIILFLKSGGNIMTENKCETKTKTKGAAKASGQIQIADEVIAIIAGTAALEVDGVEAASGVTTGSLAEFFGKKNQSKGVKVSVENGEASVELDIAVKFGVKIHLTAADVQKKVKNAIETMTGLNVTVVNVNIAGITLDKPKSKEETIEEVL